MVLKPRLSEKTYALSEQSNTYVFEAPEDANKQMVAKAVTEQYGVTVTAVRIAKTPSKSRRSYRRGGRVVHRGESAGIRKAYVVLKKGDTLPIFASVEDKQDKSDTREKK